jgi:poly(3-hydroxybutyrate) depolymerase
MLSVSLFFLFLAASLQGVIAQSSGCGKSPLTSGTKNIGSRQYILQVPANYNSNTRYKLIFGFHWLNGNMNNVAPGYYGLRALAGETAIFVAPNGINAGWGNSGGSDTTFVDSILTEINNGLCVDQKQIFATGFSYGGAMSYNLACSRPSKYPNDPAKKMGSSFLAQTSSALLPSSLVLSSVAAQEARPRSPTSAFTVSPIPS